MILLLFLVSIFTSVVPASAAEIKPKRLVLENGITLLILERPSLPIVSVEALIRAGALYDPNDKAGLANLTASLLEEGTKKRSATQIADAVDFIGANLAASANEDYMTASLRVIKKEVDTGFDLLSDILINPVFRSERGGARPEKYPRQHPFGKRPTPDDRRPGLPKHHLRGASLSKSGDRPGRDGPHHHTRGDRRLPSNLLRTEQSDSLDCRRRDRERSGGARQKVFREVGAKADHFSADRPRRSPFRRGKWS
ncbi:MAG: insulinase family protein [Candidatus Manganitrophus sp.]|nr:insulinase family protein [Candidatus Manganitrophus sp.]